MQEYIGTVLGLALGITVFLFLQKVINWSMCFLLTTIILILAAAAYK